MANKVAVVVLADKEGIENLGRVVNAMETVKEFKQANEEAHLIFDGAGTRWFAEFSKPDFKYKELYNSVKDKITGACSYCASAYQVKDKVESENITLLNEFEGHPSLRKLVSQGYQVITF